MKISKELKKYIPIANLIANTFGKNCEVVIHDLTVPQNSVVYAINNHVTGRKVGQAFDHLVKQVLLSRKFDNDYVAGYKTFTEDGREIKSSTAFIRDSNETVIGALCINYNLESMVNFKEFIDEFMAIEQEKEEEENIELMENVVEIADDLIDRIIANHAKDDLKRREKINLIKFMDEKGIFLIKGSVDKVADKLGISKVTVYSYLDEIKKKRDLLDEE
ncbi:helix-turn-helix transcriptional regulator [Paenibacillus qinlingensis]|uniref:Transcriptional regulator YheO n=1 Tax=Paenibacillus qinlingensis TaxID=1837343 RepID=A0ABU1NVP4_9BACL|nr:helix-turn-helix transcriptional regulator [Paenibacillus qinlingensis]MDR6551404.1 putative transcriptional regulator YheO [Paenibacillus qinlingensis]